MCPIKPNGTTKLVKRRLTIIIVFIKGVYIILFPLHFEFCLTFGINVRENSECNGNKTNINIPPATIV